MIPNTSKLPQPIKSGRADVGNVSIVRSDDTHTSTLTSLAGTMVSSPSCNLRPRLPRVRQQRLDPAHRSTVLSAFSFSLLADIQWPTSESHRSSCRAVDVMSSRRQCSCVSSLVGKRMQCHTTPCFSVYKMNNLGPKTQNPVEHCTRYTPLMT